MYYPIRYIKKLLSEPLVWVVFLIIRRLLAKLRSAIYAWILKAPGLNIGGGSIIKGIKYIYIGQNVFINEGLWLEAIAEYGEQSFKPIISIGNNVSFSRNVHLGCIDQILIGNNVLFGSHIYVSDHNHGSYVGLNQSSPSEPPAQRILASGGPVIIEDNVWIGDNVTILGPAKIGMGAIIAANSFIKGDVLPYTMVGGTPFRMIKKFDFELKKWIKITAL